MSFALGLLIGFVLGGLFVFVRETLAHSKQNRELGRQIRLLLDSGNVERLRKLAALVEGDGP